MSTGHVLAESRALNSPTPSLVDYLVGLFMQKQVLSTQERMGLTRFQSMVPDLLKLNPPVGYRHEGNTMVVRLQDGKEFGIQGLDTLLKAGDGAMAPEVGQSHIQI